MLYTAGGESMEHVMTNTLSASFIGSRGNETKRKRRVRIVTMSRHFLTCSATVCGTEKQKSFKFSFFIFEIMNYFS